MNEPNAYGSTGYGDSSGDLSGYGSTGFGGSSGYGDMNLADAEGGWGPNTPFHTKHVMNPYSDPNPYEDNVFDSPYKDTFINTNPRHDYSSNYDRSDYSVE